MYMNNTVVFQEAGFDYISRAPVLTPSFLVESESLIYLVSVLFCFACLRPVSCLPKVASFSGLNIFDCRSVTSNIYSYNLHILMRM